MKFGTGSDGARRRFLASDPPGAVLCGLASEPHFDPSPAVCLGVERRPSPGCTETMLNAQGDYL
jgi:hypothetical protein